MILKMVSYLIEEKSSENDENLPSRVWSGAANVRHSALWGFGDGEVSTVIQRALDNSKVSDSKKPGAHGSHEIIQKCKQKLRGLPTKPKLNSRLKSVFQLDVIRLTFGTESRISNQAEIRIGWHRNLNSWIPSYSSNKWGRVSKTMINHAKP